MSFRKGFSLIEVLITAFVLTIVAVAVTGLGLILTRTAIESEYKNVAEAVANEELENARAYSYTEIEYANETPFGKIQQAKTVTRNSQVYNVDSFITYVDDPRTTETQDFKQLTVKVSWPRMHREVVLSSFFTQNSGKQTEICVPGTVTCANPIGAPAPFLTCPASGKCSDVPKLPQLSPLITPTPDPRACSSNSQCQAGETCFDNTCQPAWCSIIQAAPLPDSGACEGQFIIEDCTQTCPSYRRLGELNKVSICGRDAYCVITNYTFERCPDPAFCSRKPTPKP